MTYGFRPENWRAFEHELRARGIDISDLERVEMRPPSGQDLVGAAGMIEVTVTLRSGRVETWSQQQVAAE
jgi:hypothetical protein